MGILLAGTPATMTNPNDRDPETPMLRSGLGSGLLAQQPTPQADEAVAVAKVCPQCGSEYETGDRFCPKDGTPLRPKTAGDPLVGRVIAERYLVLARLGEGGMGRVYLAEHVKMNRQCAVKVMNPSLLNDAESSTRFAREASNAARILHPNVAAVFDYGESEKIVYLVMEYVDGESLSTILARDGALDPRRAIEIARQIADGLAAAHELGIVHRDLKPDNVIVARTRGGKEVPKVVDFGIAKAITDSREDALTRSGLVIGTPEYMSPEQLLGDPVDPRADIYSLGCILYQMLTGEAAFAADSREQMIRRRLHEPPPHVQEKLPQLPRRLDTLIAHMLARSPADRIASAAEVRDALDPALALAGWSPSALGGTTLTPRSAVTAVADASLQPTMPLPKQRTSIARIVMGVAWGAALLLGGLEWGTRRAIAKYETPVAKPPQAAAPGATQQSAGAIVAAPKPVPLDSNYVRDSTAKAAKARDSVAAAQAIVQPIDNFVNAFRTRDAAQVKAAYPAMPESQLTGLQNNLFSRAEKLAAQPVIGTITRSGNTAHVPFGASLSITAKGSTIPLRSTLHYDATLELRGKKWVIVDLKSSAP